METITCDDFDLDNGISCMVHALVGRDLRLWFRNVYYPNIVLVVLISHNYDDGMASIVVATMRFYVMHAYVSVDVVNYYVHNFEVVILDPTMVTYAGRFINRLVIDAQNSDEAVDDG